MCTHRQCAEPDGLYLAKLSSRDKHFPRASLIKAPPLKVDVYLILEAHNKLFTDPTQVANEWTAKCKNHR